MADINFTGNLGAPAELAFTPNGNARLTFRAADSKSKPDGNGGWEKVSEQWLNVTVWGPLAEHLAEQGLDKGAHVQVTGEFYAREYEHNGEKRQSLDVTAWGVRVLPKRDGGVQRNQGQQQRGNASAGAGSGWGGPGWGATGNDASAPF